MLILQLTNAACLFKHDEPRVFSWLGLKGGQLGGDQWQNVHCVAVWAWCQGWQKQDICSAVWYIFLSSKYRIPFGYLFCIILIHCKYKQLNLIIYILEVLQNITAIPLFSYLFFLRMAKGSGAKKGRRGLMLKDSKLEFLKFMRQLFSSETCVF